MRQIVHSPAVQHLLRSHHIQNASLIQGTGPKGRLLKGDILLWLEKGGSRAAAASPFSPPPMSTECVPLHSRTMRYIASQTTAADVSMRDHIIEKLIQSSPKQVALLPLESPNPADDAFTQRYAVYNDQDTILGEVQVNSRLLLSEKSSSTVKPGLRAGLVWEALLSADTPSATATAQPFRLDDFLAVASDSKKIVLSTDKYSNVFDDLLTNLPKTPCYRGAEVKLTWISDRKDASSSSLFEQWSLGFEKALA